MWLSYYFADDYWGVDYFSKDGVTATPSKSKMLLMGVS